MKLEGLQKKWGKFGRRINWIKDGEKIMKVSVLSCFLVLLRCLNKFDLKKPVILKTRWVLILGENNVLGVTVVKFFGTVHECRVISCETQK